MGLKDWFCYLGDFKQEFPNKPGNTLLIGLLEKVNEIRYTKHLDQLNQTECFSHPHYFQKPLPIQLVTISKTCLPKTCLIARIKSTLDNNQAMVSSWKNPVAFFSSFSNSISGFLPQGASSAGCVSFQQPAPFGKTGPRVSERIYFDLSEKYSY